jgi:hypothetical protein
MADVYRAQPIMACQIRAARALLRWSLPDMAQKTGLGESTLRRLERAPGVPSTTVDTLMRVRMAFEGACIAFVPDDGTPEGGPGVRYCCPHELRKSPWETLGTGRPAAEAEAQASH